MAPKGKPGKALVKAQPTDIAPRGKRTPEELEVAKTVELARIRQRTTIGIIDRVYKLLRAAVGSATLIVPSYFVFLSVDAIAGKTTSFSGVIRAMVDVGINEWGAWALSGVFGVAWYTERRTRRKTIADQSGHIRELEARQAPEREQNGSGLLPDGRQKDEDKDV